jgi:hypothetical protein
VKREVCPRCSQRGMHENGQAEWCAACGWVRNLNVPIVHVVADGIDVALCCGRKARDLPITECTFVLAFATCPGVQGLRPHGFVDAHRRDVVKRIPKRKHCGDSWMDAGGRTHTCVRDRDHKGKHTDRSEIGGGFGITWSWEWPFQ